MPGHLITQIGIWDEIATLDTDAIEKAMTEGRWGGEIVGRIKAYISTEKRYTLHSDFRCFRAPREVV